MEDGNKLPAGPRFERVSMTRAARGPGLWSRVRSVGLGPALRTGLYRALGSPPIPVFRTVENRLTGATALEIGGPSAVFEEGGPFPAYPRLGVIDNVDYALETLWSAAAGGRRSAATFRRAFLGEAVSLTDVSTSGYDVVLASHVLEHLANPLRGLREWGRVLRSGGLLVTIVPEGRLTFDRRRETTPLAHMMQDESTGVQESDLGHLPEVLAQHDRARDPGAGSAAEFERRCRENAKWRAMHHHVFSVQNLGPLLATAGFRVEAVGRAPPVHLVAAGTWGTPAAPRSGEPPPR